jgi:hypothetical protein
MGSTRDRVFSDKGAGRSGRERAKDEVSLDEEIDKHGHHVTGLQLGNAANAAGTPPPNVQERRNRGEARAPAGGEAAWREGHRRP